MPRPLRNAIAALVLAVAARAAHAASNPYATQRAAAVTRCEAISPSDYQTGLMFNPDGFRSYYAQSACFQEAAVLFRDRDLCGRVRRRWSLFSSSWGYSTSNCRKLVAAGVEKDSVEIVRMRAEYARGPVRLDALTIAKNGNGRDFDILPSFSAGHAGGYQLRVDLIVGGRPVTIDSTGYHLDGADRIRGFVRQDSIRAHVPGYVPGATYRGRATLVFDIGYGGQGGMWSDDFIARLFPVAARSQSVDFDATL